jgi:hypothetical protein
LGVEVQRVSRCHVRKCKKCCLRFGVCLKFIGICMELKTWVVGNSNVNEKNGIAYRLSRTMGPLFRRQIRTSYDQRIVTQVRRTNAISLMKTPPVARWNHRIRGRAPGISQSKIASLPTSLAHKTLPLPKEVFGYCKA